MTRTIETTSPRVTRADYREFRDFAAALARWKDERISLEKGGAQ